MTTHGHYLITPAASTTPAPLLVGFHGYGEHADRHLAQLTQIPGSHRWTRVAIQGLHRFYSQSRKHVVASWMTRQDRDLAIADNLQYVNAVLDAVKASHKTNGTLIFCGFSQGVAMAYRAATCGHHKAHGIMALAGDIPPELKVESHLVWPEVLVGRGDNDDWYSSEKLNQDIEFLQSVNVPIKSLTFPGGHEWTEEFRRKAGEFLSLHDR